VEQAKVETAAEEEVRNAMRIQEEFKTKFKSFLGPGECFVLMVRLLVYYLQQSDSFFLTNYCTLLFYLFRRR